MFRMPVSCLVAGGIVEDGSIAFFEDFWTHGLIFLTFYVLFHLGFSDQFKPHSPGYKMCLFWTYSVDE